MLDWTSFFWGKTLSVLSDDNNNNNITTNLVAERNVACVGFLHSENIPQHQAHMEDSLHWECHNKT